MYSQNNEEEVIAKYLDLSKPGTYVDVGSGPCTEISNTYFLYKLGWRGLCIDAHPDYAHGYTINRPKDIFLNIAVWDKETIITMSNTVPEGSWLFDEYRQKNYKMISVATKTMDQIIGTYPQFADADLFSLDVELSENKVFAKCQMALVFRPKLMIIEHQVRGISSKPLWETEILELYDHVDTVASNAFNLRKPGV